MAGMAPPVGTGRPPRPSTVTYASMMLYALAALQIIGIPVSLAIIGPTRDAVRQAIEAENPADAETIRTAVETATTIGVVIGVALSVLFAVGWIVLGLLDSRGKNAARIVTWVLGGIFLCCTGFGLLSSLVNVAGFGPGASAGGLDQEELQRRIDAATPVWYQPATVGLGVVNLLLVIGACILLALPASNEYFRKPQPTWTPPSTPGYPPQDYPPAG